MVRGGMDEGQSRMKNGWHVVLVDDEADIREIIAIVLTDLGCRVSVAGDGRAGLNLCLTEHPQLVITDIRMPDMDGLRLLEAVKAADADIEVIVMTAFGEMELAIKALRLDASDFINKPVSRDVLQVALERAQNRYASRRQLKDYTIFLERENVNTSRELMRIYALQKNLIESSIDGVIGCDAQEMIRIFNKSMEQLSGLNRSAVIGRLRLADVFGAEGLAELKADFDSARYGGPNRLLLYDAHIRGVRQERIPVQISAARIPADPVGDNNASGMVLYCRDLRKIRELEMELKDRTAILHQDKMMSLGRLAASIVHEINNPLAGLLNYFRLMLRMLQTHDLDQERRDKFIRYLELVETETERCAKIIGNLLAFSRKNEPSFASVDIRNLLERCILLCQHKLELSHIRLKTLFPQVQLPAITGDANQLQQCLINLIFNAIDAMPDGGELTLAAEWEPAEQAVVILVQDTGVGIEAQDLPHIFEPFFTTKKEGYGVGLGLSTVYGIVAQHRGKIQAMSAKGQGTIFEMRLPMAAGQSLSKHGE